MAARSGSAARFDAVVAVDQAGGIGLADGLPWPRLKGDLAYFKRITSSASPGRQNAVVMGRTTWETLRGKPLPGRINVVLSRRPDFAADGVIVAHGFDEALALADAAGAEQIFVVGGAALYAEAFRHPRCGAVYLTQVLGTFPADTFLPPLDGFGFHRSSVLGDGEDDGVAWRIERWQRG
jgi:dihydrofolate reductase